ncbi:MAG: NAD(P)H-dependent oxidoreductase subunit E [Thermodesulfovibrionia bacterium]|nr:NAD(P)H-dependent oxidoreductase subunit E [Thermodesulfovibrionia bacterium]
MNLKADEMIGHIGEVLSETQKKRGILIYAFQRIQEEYNYLPEDVLRKLSQELDISLSDVYSTASFYKQFYFTPRGKKIVKVCTGTACHVRGADEVLNKIESEFKIKEGETAPDLSMTLETVGCIGCCGLAPVATINNDIMGEIDRKKINKVIQTIKEEKQSSEK